MKFFYNKNFILLIGLLFVTAVSFHSIEHRFIDDEISHVECLLCDNTLSDSLESEISIHTLKLSEILKVGINEYFISLNLNSYYSRAPPR